MIKNIKINNLTHKVIMKKEDRFVGIKGENKYETLKFTFEDEFLNGEGILEIQKPNSQKEYIILEKEEDCYLLEIKNSLLNVEGEITMQLVVRLTDNRVFKSVEFTMQVLKAIEATTEIPDEYETWDSTLAAKILEIDSKLEDMTDLEQDLEEKRESGYFKGEKGDTGEPGQDGINGQDGQDGKNGADGKSAYQIWLDEGNEGTEQDFLNSLKGEKGQDGVNGVNGQNGTNGVDGFSPVATVQETEEGATISITDKNGTTSVEVKNGKDGENGTNGTDGYTPVKGTDYWTNADKQEIKQYCDEQIGIIESALQEV